MTKLCVRCKEEKDQAAFRPNPRMKSGLHSWCKACTKGYQRERARKIAAAPKRDFLTVRFTGDVRGADLLRSIQKEASKEGVSRNRMALRLMQEALDARFQKELEERAWPI